VTVSKYWNDETNQISPLFSILELRNSDDESSTRGTIQISFLRWENLLNLSNPIFLPPAYSPALIYFGQERGWWVTCNYPTVLTEKNINRNIKTYVICRLKSVLHEEKSREQENHNVAHYDFPVPDAFPHVVWTLANR
jgi:hypothetical protein